MYIKHSVLYELFRVYILLGRVSTTNYHCSEFTTPMKFAAMMVLAAFNVAQGKASLQRVQSVRESRLHLYQK